MTHHRPHLRLAILSFLVLALGASAWAQDTRGSLVLDSLVSLPNGTTLPVQDITPGTVIWTWMPPAAPLPGKVTAVRRQNTDNYFWLQAGDRQIQATGSHRIALVSGKMVRLDAVKKGDEVWIWSGKESEKLTVTSMRNLPANMVAYDLTVEGNRLFLVNGIVVGD